VLKPPQTRHAVSAPAPKAVTAPASMREEPRQTATVQAPSGGQPPAAAQKQPVAAKAARSSDDEWWTE